jgi:hypothetical protein
MNDIRQYRITITGKAGSPLLLHNDNIEWADLMEEWKLKASKDESKNGDDRTPGYRWTGCLYHDDSVVCIPQENIMRCLMEAGAMVLTGKGQKTFKEQTQSGMTCVEAHWPLLIAGSQIPMAPIKALNKTPSYTENRKAAQDMGFDLFMKRARVGTSKHVRVRPIFRNWSLTGTFAVWDKALTEQALINILEFAGDRKGLGDWRPGAKTPGQFGRFDATVKKI